MSLRGEPVTATTTLPDGREAEVWVGVPGDPYLPRRELETVALEVRVAGEVTATLNTLLDVDDNGEARRLVRLVAEGLASGRLEPTAHALEPLADSRP